jgi:hypothetical protein
MLDKGKIPFLPGFSQPCLGIVQAIHIGLMVSIMVQPYGLLIVIGLKCPVGIREFR